MAGYPNPIPKPKVSFKADTVTIEAAVGGFSVHACRSGDGTPKNPWKDEIAVASTWLDAEELMKAYLDGPSS